MILQFKNCTLKKPKETQTWTMPHHTAIVELANGSVVTLLLQSAPTGGPVTEASLDLRWLQHLTADGKKELLLAYLPHSV